jgi:DNA polymerase-3 subunit delta
MQLDPQALGTHLEGALAPLYLVSGDEPLQREEAADAIRAAAKGKGYNDRRTLHMDAQADWSVLDAEACSLSLFSDLRMLELRMPRPKPGREGGQALARYAQRPAQGVLLLVVTGQLDGETLKSAWCKALEGAGVHLRVWPVATAALPGWVAQRMQARGLRSDREAAAVLAERVEGNLLAAAQEIDKLYLVHGRGAITADVVAEAVADSARFDVFELVDTALAGDAARTVRVLAGLRSEGAQPIQLLGLLVFELRRLSALAREVAGGAAPERLYSRYRVWGRARQLAMRRALDRHDPDLWPALLSRCADIDRAIKGLGPGDPWDQLVAVCARIAVPARPSSRRRR